MLLSFRGLPSQAIEGDTAILNNTECLSSSYHEIIGLAISETPMAAVNSSLITMFILVFLGSVKLYSDSGYLGRISAARKHKSATLQNVPAIPYRIPYLGHLLAYAYDSDALIQRIRDTLSFDIYALWLAGSRHYIVNSPYQAGKILQKREKEVTHVVAQCDMLQVRK